MTFSFRSGGDFRFEAASIEQSGINVGEHYNMPAVCRLRELPAQKISFLTRNGNQTAVFSAYIYADNGFTLVRKEQRFVKMS